MQDHLTSTLCVKGQPLSGRRQTGADGAFETARRGADVETPRGEKPGRAGRRRRDKRDRAGRGTAGREIERRAPGPAGLAGQARRGRAVRRQAGRTVGQRAPRHTAVLGKTGPPSRGRTARRNRDGRGTACPRTDGRLGLDARPAVEGRHCWRLSRGLHSYVRIQRNVIEVPTG